MQWRKELTRTTQWFLPFQRSSRHEQIWSYWREEYQKQASVVSTDTPTTAEVQRRHRQYRKHSVTITPAVHYETLSANRIQQKIHVLQLMNWPWGPTVWYIWDNEHLPFSTNHKMKPFWPRIAWRTIRMLSPSTIVLTGYGVCNSLRQSSSWFYDDNPKHK